jgi:hypothetical protein
MPLSIFAYSSYSFIAGFDLCHITSAQDLNPRPCADNAHKSVLVNEMMVIEPGENPTRIGNRWIFSVISSVEQMMTVCLCHYGRIGSAPA